MPVAHAKYVRMSPRKLRRVINVIRGKEVNYAKSLLKFMPYAACSVVGKVLNSAISNAKENQSLDTSNLKITKAYVDEAPVYKRWRAMSRGRAYPILKKNSHVTIVVEQLTEEEINKKPVLKRKQKTKQIKETAAVKKEKEVVTENKPEKSKKEKNKSKDETQNIVQDEKGQKEKVTRAKKSNEPKIKKKKEKE